MYNTNIFDFLKMIAATIGAITTITGFIFMISKKMRDAIMKKVQYWSGFEENCVRDHQTRQEIEDSRKEFESTINAFKSDLQSMTDFFDQKFKGVQSELLEMNEKLMRTEDLEKKQLRKIITDIYTQYSSSKKLPYYIHKELVEMYAKYKDEYNGNSYADEIYHIMQDWDVETLDLQK